MFTLEFSCNEIKSTNFSGDNYSTSTINIENYRLEEDTIIFINESGDETRSQIIIILNETTLILQNDFAVNNNITKNYRRQ